jgi:hypothetical protein
MKEEINTHWLKAIKGCGMKELEKKASNDTDLLLWHRTTRNQEK